MATDATGTPTSLGIPKYNTAVDPPSGRGFNAAMDAIDALVAARISKPASPGTDELLKYNGTTWVNGKLVNANVDAAAAISYSKLSLAASIVNADIANAAAIAYSKLSLANSIVNADIAAGAAISYSKLNLASSLVNADIANAAAIAVSKLAAGTEGQILKTVGGVPTWAAESGGSVTDPVTVHLQRNTNQSIANLTHTAVSWDIEVGDASGMHSAGNPERMTIVSGEAGIYLLTGFVSFAANATGERIITLERYNSGGTIQHTTQVVRVPANSVASAPTILSFAYQFGCFVGDYIIVKAYQSSGGALNVVESLVQLTRLTR